jgi:type I restriction enzyme M protein
LKEVTRERAQSFLTPKHQERILQTFRAFAAEDGFSTVATLAQIAANGASLSIPLYVKRSSATMTDSGANQPATLKAAWAEWESDGRIFWQQMDSLVETLDGVVETGEAK